MPKPMQDVIREHARREFCARLAQCNDYDDLAELVGAERPGAMDNADAFVLAAHDLSESVLTVAEWDAGRKKLHAILDWTLRLNLSEAGRKEADAILERI